MAKLTVRDYKGNEIKKGTKVIYGSPVTPEEIANQTAEVTEIGEPDVTFHEDEYGRDVPDGCELTITFKFLDNVTETTKARDVTQYPVIHDITEIQEVDETYEEIGDLEVITDS